MKHVEKHEKRGIRVRYIGGPTAVIEMAGLRMLTDPTFDEPRTYDVAPGRQLVKLIGPAVPFEQLRPIDLVLLSHDQHVDNLDVSGRAALTLCPSVYSTAAAAERLGSNTVALRPWQTITIESPEGPLSITALPAQHGPDGSEHLTGEVIGFLVRDGQGRTVYISGDNASLRVVHAIAERYPSIDLAILFAGAARTALVPGENLTLSSAEAAQAARILKAAHVVVLHFEGWGHFTEGRGDVARAFADADYAETFAEMVPGATRAF